MNYSQKQSFRVRSSSKQMFLKLSKISLCRSLFLINFINLINFIKNRVQHRFFPVKFAKFLWTPFYRTPPVAASVFCKDFVNMRILILILEDPMWLQLIYFLNTISFWFVEFLSSIDGTLTLGNYFRVHSWQVLKRSICEISTKFNITQRATMVGPEGPENVWKIKPPDARKTHSTDKIMKNL